MSRYEHSGHGYISLRRGDYPIAWVEPGYGDQAADLLRRAMRANDQRRYTASARLNARAEELPGFQWTDERFNAKGAK